MSLENKKLVLSNFSHKCCQSIETIQSTMKNSYNSYNSKFSNSVLKNTLAKRKRLWELEHNYHCAVIGTCLSIKEVRNLLRQFQVKVDNYCDYDIHTIAVTMLEEKDHRSKKINIYLDKKFKPVIQSVKKMDYSALKKYWHNALQTGDMIGTFWALLSHPLSDAEMQRDIYGDIHMLSHLSGASNRADLTQLQKLRDERFALSKEINLWKIKSHNKLTEVNKLKNELNRQLKLIRCLEQKNKQIQENNNKLLAETGNSQYQKLQFQIQKNLKQEDRISLLEKSNKSLKEQSKILEANQQEDNFLIPLHQVEAQKNISRPIQLDESEQADCEQCGLKDDSLCGRCILYVGGQTGMMPHYKDIVESQSAVFMHHDGGIEKNTQELTNMLNRADLVICPTSCISHKAYWQIKKSCKKQNKPCKFIKSSGVSSLTRTLKNISETEF